MGSAGRHAARAAAMAGWCYPGYPLTKVPPKREAAAPCADWQQTVAAAAPLVEETTILAAHLY